MKILMFGRGVITTQYAWALEKAGNSVEFYVRPGRIAQYGPSVNLDILDGRRKPGDRCVKEVWPHVLRDSLDGNHGYDLIFLSVGPDKFAQAAAFLGPRVGKATVLVFDNFLSDPRGATAVLPSSQLVWGFPGGGGGFDEAGVLKGGFMKLVFLGTFGTRPSDRDRAVGRLFREAGFSISASRDFGSWLRFHFLLDAAFGAETLKAGGIAEAMDSGVSSRNMVLGLRELVPLAKARGGRIEPWALGILLGLPAGLVGFLMNRAAFRKGSLARTFMEGFALGRAGLTEMKMYPRETLAEARRLGIPVPRLEAAEALFSEEHR